MTDSTPPSATVAGNSWRVPVQAGSLVVPADKEAFDLLSRAGVNELELITLADGQPALRVRERVPGYLVLSSPAWVSEQIAAQVALAMRLQELEGEKAVGSTGSPQVGSTGSPQVGSTGSPQGGER